MDLAAVAVVGFLVGLPRREVERAGDFFVEQNIAHRLEDVRIKAERKFADVTRARIGIENLIQLFGLIARRFDDFSVAKIEPNVVESRCPDKWSAR